MKHISGLQKDRKSIEVNVICISILIYTKINFDIYFDFTSYIYIYFKIRKKNYQSYISYQEQRIKERPNALLHFSDWFGTNLTELGLVINQLEKFIYNPNLAISNYTFPNDLAPNGILLIWCQNELVLNQSEKCDYNPNLDKFNKIQHRFLGVRAQLRSFLSNRKNNDRNLLE